MKIKNFILSILMIICLGVAGFSAYKLYEIYNIKETVKTETKDMIDKVVTKDEQTQKSSINWQALKEENPDIVAWLYMPSAGISFPVVQGSDNEYYLTYTVKGEYNPMGSIFMDANANPDFTDDNTIIYGHSVDGGGMFTDLDKFQDANFFYSNPVYYILTPDQNYECQIIFFGQVDETTALYTTSFGDFKDEVLKDMASVSTYTRDLDPGNYKLVTLSTCNLDYGFHSTQRLALTAIMVPVATDIDIK